MIGFLSGLRARHAVAAAIAVTSLGATVSAAEPPDSTVPSTSEPTWSHVSTEPCPDRRFDCITLAVPRDHAAPDGPTWEVTFGLLGAAVESKGTFVTITGGPGTSGLAAAGGYTDAMAPAITDNFDIVFIDQRGIGASQPVRCDEAAAAYYQSDADPADPAQRDAVAADTQSFVDECIAEAGVPTDDLPYYATRQAVEDLEAIRQYLGVDRFVLYGESYGTQYVQTYAAAHPDNVAMLILDGVVDLTVDALPYWAEGARAHDDVLEAVLQGCTADKTCAVDAGGDALAAYDALASTLDAGPIAYDFPMADGTVQPRSFGATDLDLAAAGMVYSLGDRQLFQRALAAAASGNLVPLARLAYSSVSVDPETLDVVVDPAWSDAAYYAVECQDYEFLPDAGTPRQRLDAWLDEGAAAGIADLRLGSIFYGDLPCLYWPQQPADVPRPAPITDPPYPTLVLTADTDGPTPIVNAMRVFARLEDSYLVLLEGGPHIIFDWGYACVDDLVSDAIVSGEPPSIRVTVCEGDVADPYVANAPADAQGYDDPLDAASAVAAQLTASSEYASWDPVDILEVGCDFGGAVEYVPSDVGTDIELTGCELTDGVPVSGSGAIDDVAGTVHLELVLPAGDLSFNSDGVTATVAGMYGGEPVDTSDSLP